MRNSQEQMEKRADQLPFKAEQFAVAHVERGNARHPNNAMLNYGYGILISHVCKQVVAAGFDPSIGVTHGDDRNRIPLVYDLMEPLRPVVDRRILEFALGNVFRPGDFTINKFGGCRLNPQMARAIARQSEMQVDGIVTGFQRLLRNRSWLVGRTLNVCIWCIPAHPTR